MNKNQIAEMITQSTILEMGWTKSMITKLLPEPTLKLNPHYRSAAPMRIWKKQMENMRQHLPVTIKRKISSTSAVEIERLNPTENMRCYYAA